MSSIDTDDIVDFSGLIGIPTWLLKQLEKLEIRKPTCVQKATIPQAFHGSDIIGSARTGQGKTLCFAIPILKSVSEDPGVFRALILTPTRELALQIAQQFAVLSESIKLKVVTIIGGVDLTEQQRRLSERPHVLVATPGRLAQICLDGTCNQHLQSLKRTKFLVLDEADRLLTPEFSDSLKVIMEMIPKERQNLFFSATITQSIKLLASSSSSTTKKVVFYEDKDLLEEASYKESETGIEKWPTPSGLQMFYLFVPPTVKECYLLFLVKRFLNPLYDHTADDMFTSSIGEEPSFSSFDGGRSMDSATQPNLKPSKGNSFLKIAQSSVSSNKNNKISSSSTSQSNGKGDFGRRISQPSTFNSNHLYRNLIIFVPTCQLCEELTSMLNFAEPPVGAVRMHRWMRQKERSAALESFKSGKSPVLVATDLASRGLDIPNVPLVIQFNVPYDPKTYIHRVGRVARRDTHGKSIVIIEPSQVNLFLSIEKHLDKKVQEIKIPDHMVLKHLNESITAREMGKISLEDNGFYDRSDYFKTHNKHEKANNMKRGYAHNRNSSSGDRGGINDGDDGIIVSNSSSSSSSSSSASSLPPPHSSSSTKKQFNKSRRNHHNNEDSEEGAMDFHDASSPPSKRKVKKSSLPLDVFALSKSNE